MQPHSLIFKQGFQRFFQHFMEFLHQISLHTSEKYDSTFGIKIIVDVVKHVWHLLVHYFLQGFSLLPVYLGSNPRKQASHRMIH